MEFVAKQLPVDRGEASSLNDAAHEKIGRFVALATDSLGRREITMKPIGLPTREENYASKMKGYRLAIDWFTIIFQLWQLPYKE